MTKTANEYKTEIKRKKRLRSFAINSLALMGAIALFTLLGFSNKKQNSTVCWKLEVSVSAPSDKKYIDESLVTKIVESSTEQITGKLLSEIDINAIHKKLMENSSIKEAFVYTTVDGRCVVEVTQRSPIARIINENGSSFYLDKDGFTMALSSTYTAKVPVFTGEIYEVMTRKSILDYLQNDSLKGSTLLDDIYIFTNAISKDPFWKAQVEHVHINSRKEFEIIPRVGNHKIVLGSIDDLETKFKKLMAFYHNTIYTKDLNVYSAVDVKYDGQVVCIKREY